MRIRTTIRTFTFSITDPAIPRTFVFNQQLENDILCIKGLHLNSRTRRDFILNGRNTAGLIIDNQELFPDNTPASLFSCSGDIPFADKFFLFLDRNDKPNPEPVKLGRLEFHYTHRTSEEEEENLRIYRFAQAALLDAVAAAAPADLPQNERLALERALSGAYRNVVWEYDVELALLVDVNV